MATAQMHWAGKRLSPAEEDELRSTVALLERTGHADLAANFARFLPERDADWTPDELELAAGVGPWVAVGADVTDRPPLGPSAHDAS
jgi:hypothetical protein